MPRKATGSEGHARDCMLRITENDKEYLEGIGGGNAYDGLVLLIRGRVENLARSVRPPPPKVERLPAPAPAKQYGAPRFIPPSRFVGKK